VSRDDVGVARKPTPPPQEMQKCVDESSMRLKEEVTPKETSKEKKEEEKEKEQEREKEEETQDIDEDLEALKKRLVRFYEVYKPNQIPRVPDIAKKYAHRTNELFQALEVRNLFSHFFFLFLSIKFTYTYIYIYRKNTVQNPLKIKHQIPQTRTTTQLPMRRMRREHQKQIRMIH